MQESFFRPSSFPPLTQSVGGLLGDHLHVPSKAVGIAVMKQQSLLCLSRQATVVPPSSYTFPVYVNSSLNSITLITIAMLGTGQELTQLTPDDRHFVVMDGATQCTSSSCRLAELALVPVGVFKGALRASLVGGSVGVSGRFWGGKRPPVGGTRSYTLGHSL